jgi:hypothetical protein
MHPNTRRLKMKARTLVSILILVLAVLMITIFPWSSAQSEDYDNNRPKGEVIFKLGQEDKSEYDFTARSFKDNPEYTCHVGVDCSTETFPPGMYRLFPGYVNRDVKCVTIIFDLKRHYKELVLRLARSGSETTVVVIDGTQTYHVTGEMLGSREGNIFGVYNLSLGSFDKGTHTIVITVADDGIGNGTYGWDALALIAK